MNKSAESIVGEKPVRVPAGRIILEGDLALSEGASGLVIFAHGSGSSRHSPRNRYVAQTLHKYGLSTLLFDLLTPAEERIDALQGHLRFNIRLLSERLIQAVDWATSETSTRPLAIGLFGASTGAAAALVAAAERPDIVKAVVSRGGRPDMAGSALPRVKAPSLLIVGGYDDQVIVLNQEALDRLRGEKEMVIVPGATHLFEEPGALAEVARLAGEWFQRHLGPLAQESLPE